MKNLFSMKYEQKSYGKDHTLKKLKLCDVFHLLLIILVITLLCFIQIDPWTLFSSLKIFNLLIIKTNILFHNLIAPIFVMLLMIEWLNGIFSNSGQCEHFFLQRPHIFKDKLPT